MNRHRVLLTAVLAATALPGPAAPAAQELPTRRSSDGESVQEAWVQIEPRGGTGCAFDSQFSFFFHEGSNPSRLMVYFQGGGACWDGVSCSGMFDSSVQRDELADYRGIFDFGNPENPFRDFTVVFVPYCTGDVHVGDTTRRYGDDPQAPPVRHSGYRNVGAVLAWMGEQGFDPDQVVVAGASAGSYGALFYTPRIAETYPSSRLFLIGDSGLPLLKDYPKILEGWGAAPVLRRLWQTQEELEAQDLTLERAHEAAAAAAATAVLAQITSDRDAVQSAFYIISGSPRWRENTYELLDALEAGLPSFHSFVVAGSDHGLLRTDAFYTYEADGVRLRDWVRDLVGGEAVESRRCSDCRSNRAVEGAPRTARHDFRPGNSMRKQYHLRPSPAGLLAWDVDRLIEATAHRPHVQVPLDSIRELDEPYWFGGGGAAATCRAVADHARLIFETDLRYPIILGADGRVMDGMHRVAKAYLDGRDTILAVQLETDPEPDFVGVDEDALPYEGTIQHLSEPPPARHPR